MRVWDGGCRTRDGPALEHHGAGLAAHRDLATPPEMGSVGNKPGNADFQGKITAFESRTRISLLVPHLGGRAWPCGHICPPDVLGRQFREGNGAPVDGETSPLPPARAGLGTPLSRIAPAPEKHPDGTGKELEGANPASQINLIAIKLLACGWGG